MARYVLVGFDTDTAALEFLEYLDELPDDMGRIHLAAKRRDDGKVDLKRFKIRTAYLKNE